MIESEQTLTILTWLIPVGPLLAFFLIMLVTNRSRTLSWLVAWAGVFSALILGWIVALSTVAVDAHHLSQSFDEVVALVDLEALQIRLDPGERSEPRRGLDKADGPPGTG